MANVIGRSCAVRIRVNERYSCPKQPLMNDNKIRLEGSFSSKITIETQSEKK